MKISKPYILIADDCDLTAAMIETALRDMYATHRVSNGIEVLDYIKENQPPIMFLLDITMPGMSGIEVCRYLKNTKTTRDVPVLFITSAAGPMCEVAGFDVGAVDYITKPISFPVLQARVRTHVDLNRAKKSAEEASRLKSNILSAVTHELRTPLAGIHGFADLIKCKSLVCGSGASCDEWTTYIRECTETELRYINDLIKTSEMMSRTNVVNEDTLYISSIIDIVIGSLSYAAREKNIFIKPIHEDGAIALIGDESTVTLAITSLIRNSIKFSPNNATIDLAFEIDKEGNAGIMVVDSGIGISRADINRVIEPFYQIDSGSCRKYEGLGIGLTLAKHAVELHGGFIEITSNLGQGTAVTLWFPKDRIVGNHCPTNERNRLGTIDTFISIHVAWAKALAGAVSSGRFSGLSPEKIGQDSLCMFGSWLISPEARVAIPIQAYYDEIITLHRSFHINAAILLNFHLVGDQDAAAKMISLDGDFTISSESLIAALRNLSGPSPISLF